MGSRFYENISLSIDTVFEEGFRIVYKLRNADELRGLNFGKREPDAQNEFHRYARAESRDFRDGSRSGAVAENASALSLHSFSRAGT